jgi:acylphosphatase
VIVSRAGEEEQRLPAARYLVRGRVQGVGYRYFVLRHAEELGLAGFARNLPDGSVEVIAEGGAAALKKLEALLGEGPSFCHVTGVERQGAEERGASGFHVR